jgi:NTP pyrophosphatase (non-canonical NTP hydrolase)
MNFNDYQKQAITTDTFGGKMDNLSDFGFLEKAFGLVGEAGEAAEKLKRIFRERRGELSDEDKHELIKEFGDVLWYISALSHYLGVTLDDVASQNLEKVLSRKQRGQTYGSGDNR